MTRTMRDSTTAGDIPVHGTELVAGYINGKFAWTQENYNRFPGIPHISIDIHGDAPHAGVLDVEEGCAELGVVPGWVKARKEALPHAYPPIIYCNRSALTPIFNLLAGHDLHVVRDFRLWIATLDGTKAVHDMTGVTAVQYKHARPRNPDGSFAGQPGPATAEGHFDESLVYDDDWHRHP
jgi:hypothetical protein